MYVLRKVIRRRSLPIMAGKTVFEAKLYARENASCKEGFLLLFQSYKHENRDFVLYLNRGSGIMMTVDLFTLHL